MENSEATAKDNMKRILLVFILVHIVLWTGLSFFRNEAYGDSIEALAWGMTGEWGTNKHPPLAGWLAEIAYRATGGNTDLALYGLGQLCVGFAMIFVYKLARRYVSPGHALLSAIFLEGTVYYSNNSVNYNPNILSLALVPAIVWFVHEAVREDRAYQWGLAGVFAGLALLTKFTNGMLLLSLFVYLVAAPEGRARFRGYGPYLAFAVAAALVLPHVMWLAHYDFRTLEYSRERALEFSGVGQRVGRGLLNLFVVSTAQVLKALGSLALFAFVYYKTPRGGGGGGGRLGLFLFCAGVLPLVITAVMTAVAGTHTYPKYAYAFIGYFPLMLFVLVRVTDSAVVRRWAVVLSYVVMAGMLVYTGLVNVRRKSGVYQHDAFVAAVEGELGRRGVDGVRYVGGDYYLTVSASAYLSSRPRPFFEMDPGQVVWEDEGDLVRGPTLVLARSLDEYEGYRGRYSGLREAERVVIPPRGFAKAPFELYVGVLGDGH